MDPSCIPSIVTAIDSGRESDIVRKNSPRRTSTRDKKMRNRGSISHFIIHFINQNFIIHN